MAELAPAHTRALLDALARDYYVPEPRVAEAMLAKPTWFRCGGETSGWT